MTDIDKLLEDHPLPWATEPEARNTGRWHAVDASGCCVFAINPTDKVTVDFVVALVHALHAERQRRETEDPAIRAEMTRLRRVEQAAGALYRELQSGPTGSGYKRTCDNLRDALNDEHVRDLDLEQVHQKLMREFANRGVLQPVADKRFNPPLNDSGDVDALRYRIGDLERRVRAIEEGGGDE